MREPNQTEISRVVVAILTAGLLVLSLTALAMVDPDKNQPEFWGEDCHKIDESQDGSWTSDGDYRLVVLKAGTDNFEFYNVELGDVLSVGRNISHLILCTGGTPSTSTTTTSLGTSSTTTTPISTTTTVGTTVTSSVTTTSSSVPPETTTTQPTTTTTEETTTSAPITTTTISSTTSSSSVATTQPTTPTTSLTTVTSSLPATTTTVPTTSDTPLALPLTGVHLTAWAGLAFLLLTTGVVLRRWSQTKRS